MKFRCWLLGHQEVEDFVLVGEIHFMPLAVRVTSLYAYCISDLGRVLWETCNKTSRMSLRVNEGYTSV